MNSYGVSQVPQCRVDPVLVVVKERFVFLWRLQLAGSSGNPWSRRTLSSASCGTRDSMCPFCSGVFTAICSSFSPSTDIDFRNAFDVYCEPLSALMISCPGTTSPWLTRAFSTDIMAFSLTADKSKQYATHSLPRVHVKHVEQVSPAVNAAPDVGHDVYLPDLVWPGCPHRFLFGPYDFSFFLYGMGYCSLVF